MLPSIMRRHSVQLAAVAVSALLALSSNARAQGTPGMPGAPGTPSAPSIPNIPTPAPSEPSPPTPVGPGSSPALPTPPVADPAPLPPPPEAPPPAPAPGAPGSAAFEPLPDSPKAGPKPAPKAAQTAPVAVPRAATSPSAARVTEPEPERALEPPATAPADTYQPVNHAEPEPERDESWGLLGPIRLGFLLGTGLPEILSLGGQIKLTKYFGAGINVGLIPTVKISYYGEATMKYQEYDLYGHIYPFGGAFFLGAGVGYASIDGTLTKNINLASIPGFPAGAGLPTSVDVNSEASVRTLVLTPQIGFTKIFSSGFALGIDIGAQIPIAPSSVEFKTAAPQVPAAIQDAVKRQYLDPNDQKVRDTLEKIGRTPIPTIAFRVGFFL